MKTKNSFSLSLSLLAAVMALGVQMSSAVTLLSDNFDSYPAAATLPLPWHIYHANAGTLENVQAYSDFPLAGNAPYSYGSSGANVLTRAFTSTTLAAAGDSITISMDFAKLFAGQNASPLVGFYNDNGAPLTANSLDDGSTGQSATIGWTGSEAEKLQGATSDSKFFKSPNPTAGYSFYGFGGELQTTSSGIAIAANTAYSYQFTATRQSNDDLLLTSTFGGYNSSFTVAAVDVQTYTFNQAVVAQNGAYSGSQSYLDNVLVTTTVGAGSGPIITNQPAQTTVSLGATATFTVGVSNTVGASYQWQFYGVNISDGGNRSGTTTKTLTVTGVSTSDVGHYRVKVINGSGDVFSSDATLAIVGFNFYPVLAITGLIGDTYRMDYATALAPATWIPFSTNVLVTSPTLVFDTGSPGANTRSYRAVCLAP